MSLRAPSGVPGGPQSDRAASSTSIPAAGGHPVASLRVLVWAALGVVFGDIGTSPLYAMSETVSSHFLATRGQTEKVTMAFGKDYGSTEVFGWTSMFFWAIAIVVTLKYVMLIMRADNEGEGGMFSILALLKAKASAKFSAAGLGAVVTVAVLGSGLILGDGVITPSLSIISAWEGLEVVTHRWSPYIPWLSIATLIVLFRIQRFGTAKVGAIFAPAMALWFGVLAVMGAVNLARHPEILAALNPAHAARYMVKFPRATLFVVGSVDLCITGCEALYADMGHFTRRAVQRAWFWVVWPALALNYLGQGARMLDPAPIVDGNVFYSLVPSSPAYVYGLVLLSWLATIIASQALISGAFSLVHQAIQLGLCPRLHVVHTNAEVEGQIYVPEVNWAYLAACIVLVLVFRTSHALAPAYGLAVTGTMALTTVLFYLVATRVWGWRRMLVGPVCAMLIVIDLAFFVSNATQFVEGGYITILIAMFCAFVMLTWRKGRALLGETLRKAALPLDVFFSRLEIERPSRVGGTAVFMTSNPGIPPSLVHYFKHSKTLHETVLLLTVQTRHVPEVTGSDRLMDVKTLGRGFYSATVVYGFMQAPDIPSVLRELHQHGVPVTEADASYFLGRESLVFSGRSRMSLVRKSFFKVLSQNSMAASAFFKIPPDRVVELGIQVEI
jgi:KUP system potassium uptake protein